MKYGLVTGKFAPLHNGHIELINQAATQVDHLFVVMSFDRKWLNKLPEKLQDKLSLENRLLWLKSTYKDLDHVSVTFIDETDIAEYPHGWEQWTGAIKKKLLVDFAVAWQNIDDIFASESEYKDGWKKFFPGATFHVVDEARREVHISATRVRKDIFANWEYIPSIVRREFALKVCVIGTESTGKTTLVKYLAKRFNTSWVEEYGRTFVENDLCGDESLLQPKHYPYIAMKQKMMEHESLAGCNRILFVDTNAVVTNRFLMLYNGIVDPTVGAIAHQEDYDLVLFLTPDVKWVADGLRMHGDHDKRQELAMSLFVDQRNTMIRTGVPLTRLHTIEGNYNQRFNEAVALVKALM